jgi:hypothetical protein
VLRGWIHDHEWRVLLLCLLVAALLPLGLDGRVDSPLGDGFAAVSVPIAVTILSAGGFALSLRSRLASALVIDTPWRCRAAWLVVTGLTALACAAMASAFLHPWPHTLHVVATVAFGSALLTLWLGEGAGLSYLFACFAATLITPRGAAAPPWSPILHHETGPVRLALSTTLVVTTLAVYVTNACGRARY